MLSPAPADFGRPIDKPFGEGKRPQVIVSPLDYLTTQFVLMLFPFPYRVLVRLKRCTGVHTIQPMLYLPPSMAANVANHHDPCYININKTCATCERCARFCDAYCASCYSLTNRSLRYDIIIAYRFINSAVFFLGGGRVSYSQRFSDQIGPNGSIRKPKRQTHARGDNYRIDHHHPLGLG